ncbi:unnamed protein product [Linum tenue]|uniref:Translation initiation factor eIF2B subunit delta n=1 Tax=Linum tenue TaxID=586396 RepID=A0AAV0MXY9_9ROSI|nr:unnamed protein product [Linum tenue]
MDPRRPPRTVPDPKVRHVGFFAPGADAPPPPDRSNSAPPDPLSSSPPAAAHLTPPGTSISPVMIPPPRHSAAPLSPRRRDSFIVGSYSGKRFLDVGSPTASTASATDDWALPTSADSAWVGDTVGAGASSLPPVGSAAMIAKGLASSVPATAGLTAVSNVHRSAGVSGKPSGAASKVQGDKPKQSKPLKEKTTKAERRALQEAQRAAKAAAKGVGGKASVHMSEVVLASDVESVEVPKAHFQRNDIAAVNEKKVIDRQLEKDRKKDVPQPRMQYDDKSRVEKAKKRAVLKQTEARNRVELFRHLPQYERGTLLPDLQSRFFQLDPVHPAISKVGFQYLSGDISGSNARCIAMLQAIREAIIDYSVPPGKALVRDLTSKIGSYVSFLIECRPLSISMGNAIRYLKNRIAKLPLTLSESEAKATVVADIDRFIHDKIILADKMIVKHAVTKIRDGDVLLTYGSSSVVEMILLHAHELGKQFRVVVVDSRPKLEGQLLLRKLVGKGLSCTYTHINAISYIMHEVSRVFLGASSVLSNGTVYSRVGTACVAMVAHTFHVPVMVCCETYKFHERVQLDSICSNELGDPDVICKVRGRDEINFLDGWTNGNNLQLLNLIYDATPSDYVSMIITDYGMVPPTSVPVIVREYRKEQLWI